jgi:carboxypeptidase Taq
MLPAKSGKTRADQLKLLSGIQHDMETDPNIGILLEEIESSGQILGEYEAANVKLARKKYDKNVKISKELAEERAHLSSTGFVAWVSITRLFT